MLRLAKLVCLLYAIVLHARVEPMRNVQAFISHQPAWLSSLRA